MYEPKTIGFEDDLAEGIMLAPHVAGIDQERTFMPRVKDDLFHRLAWVIFNRVERLLARSHRHQKISLIQ